MAKRTPGEGTVWQDKKGLWRGELTIGYDADGKRRKKSFSSRDRETLLKKMNDEKHNLNRNIVTVSGDYTVAEWIRFWLENYKSGVVKSKTYDSYEYSLDRHIKNAIGNIKLNKIRTEPIQQLYNDMRKRNLSTTTIRITHVTLPQAFDQAIRNQLIHTNPCKATVRPKSEKRKTAALTSEQQDAFVRHCSEGSTFHKLFVFLLHTGVRVGEAKALVWDDVDFSDKTVSVNKTASTVINRDEDAETKTKVVIGSAKTKYGDRTVPMNMTVERLLAGMDKGDNPFVFSLQAKTMLADRNILRSFKGLLKKAGLPDSVRVHDLRHTFATRLLEKNVNPKIVSELLGHASVQVTLDIYSHVMPNVKSDAIYLLD